MQEFKRERERDDDDDDDRTLVGWLCCLEGCLVVAVDVVLLLSSRF